MPTKRETEMQQTEAGEPTPWDIAHREGYRTGLRQIRELIDRELGQWGPLGEKRVIAAADPRGCNRADDLTGIPPEEPSHAH